MMCSNKLKTSLSLYVSVNKIKKWKKYEHQCRLVLIQVISNKVKVADLIKNAWNIEMYMAYSIEQMQTHWQYG